MPVAFRTIQILRSKFSFATFDVFCYLVLLIYLYFAVLLFTVVEFATSAFATVVTFDFPFKRGPASRVKYSR